MKNFQFYSVLLLVLFATPFIGQYNTLSAQSVQGVRIIHLVPEAANVEMLARQVSPTLPLWRDIPFGGASQIRAEIPPSNYEFIVRTTGASQTELFRRSFTVRAGRYYNVVVADSNGTLRPLILDWEVTTPQPAAVQARFIFASASARKLAVALGGNIYFDGVEPFVPTNFATIAWTNFSSITLYDASTYDILTDVAPEIEAGNSYTFFITEQDGNYSIRVLTENNNEPQIPLPVLGEAQGVSARFVSGYASQQITWFVNQVNRAQTPALSASEQLTIRPEETLLSAELLGTRINTSMAEKSGTYIFTRTVGTSGSQIVFLPDYTETVPSRSAAVQVINTGDIPCSIILNNQQTELLPGAVRNYSIIPSGQTTIRIANTSGSNTYTAVLNEETVYTIIIDNLESTQEVVLLNNSLAERQAPMPKLIPVKEETATIRFFHAAASESDTELMRITDNSGRINISLLPRTASRKLEIPTNTGLRITYKGLTFTLDIPLEPKADILVIIPEPSLIEGGTPFIRSQVKKTFDPDEMTVSTFQLGNNPFAVNIVDNAGTIINTIAAQQNEFSPIVPLGRLQEGTTVQVQERTTLTSCLLNQTSGEFTFVRIQGDETTYVIQDNLEKEHKIDLCATTSVGEEAEVTSMRLSPNPASHTTTLSLWSPTPATAHIHISNALGQKITTFTASLISGSNIVPISLTTIPSGMYFVTVSYDTILQTHRLYVSE